MICDTCFKMLRGQDGRVWKGTYDLNFNHHTRMEDLRRSADMHCGICRVLFSELHSKLGTRSSQHSVMVPPTDQKFTTLQTTIQSLQSYWLIGRCLELLMVLQVSGLLKHLLHTSQSLQAAPQTTVTAPETDVNLLSLVVTASLRAGRQKGATDAESYGEIYYLTFKVRCEQIRYRRVFALQRTAEISNPPFRTPISRVTSDDEVYELCRQWIRKCECVADIKMPAWYPTRLIDLSDLRPKSRQEKNRLITMSGLTGWEDTRRVRLVEPKKHWREGRPGHSDVRYVTLSHCWGQEPKLGHQLTVGTSGSKKRYEEGVELRELPRTFRDAICFAARLPLVGYIWIDSLCIIQKNDADWLKESATMEKVYSNTFLNISATHSRNMEGGLFREREPESLLEDEVILNVAGLPGVDQSSAKAEGNVSGLVSPTMRAALPNLRRCTILDVSFWTDRVIRAPVNKRGWVLQERLSAPRVLHFCEDQVAWECREFDAAEGQPQNVQILRLASNGIVEESKLRGFGDINGDGCRLGQRLRAARLAGLTDLDSTLPGIYALELWGRIVEEYSMTAITNGGDKLIAISGVARRMAPAMQLTGALANMPEYVAGLWTLHIASQLLWFVEPDFLESTGEKNGIFSNRSTAPAKEFYRAPSFSWAAVDANEMRGIKYAETTDKDLLIEVVDASATAKHGSDIFGILKDARLTIRGKLRRARIDGPNEKGRYRWHLVDREGLNEEQHRNVYLDCPQRDRKITGHDANIFVVPAARGSRLAPQGSKYMICLLLQLVLEGEDGRKKAFRRVGLTKLSPWADSKALEMVDDRKGERMARILIPKARDNDMPHVRGYNAKDGTHEILLV